MLFKNLVAVAAMLGGAVAQRPDNTSICDFYTMALTKDNSAKNQLTVLTLLVNTAVIGNYSSMGTKNAVPGILNSNATFNGTSVNLVPYFSGGFVSTNRGGKATSVNFLDRGGAVPLMQNMPANSNSSNQATLLTHLYSYFGTALGCTQVGKSDFPAYTGSASQYDVHKFMDLDANEVGYFIQQVGLSAASFGVADSDVQAVGKLLTDTFSMRCSPKAKVIPSQDAELQAICIADSCPEASNPVCDQYDKAVEPATASAMPSGSAGSSGSAGGSGSAGASATGTAAGAGSSGDSGSGSTTGAAITSSRMSISAALMALASVLFSFL